MIEREERERVQTQSVVVRVVCDRCGKDLRKMAGGFPRSEWEGAWIEGDLYPTQNIVDAEHFEYQVCGDCLRLLRLWIVGSG